MPESSSRYKSHSKHYVSAQSTSTGSSTQQKQFLPAVCFATGSLNLHILIVGTQPESAPALCQSTRMDFLFNKAQMERGEAKMQKEYCPWITSPASNSHWTFSLSL